MKQPTKTLIYDISNLLFRVASVQKYSNPYARDASVEDVVGLCMHISVTSIFKWYQKYRPDFVVFAFEGQNNWRKKYTADIRAKKQYKGNRAYDPAMSHYYELIESFRDTVQAHTSISCLRIEGMEADDAIAGYCQLYSSDDHEVNIVSGDRDFIQLLKLPKVRLVDPATGKLRNQKGDKDYTEDLDYWLFLKCVRGDGGDHVPSAYPKVREVRIKKAYASDYDRANFMNERWTDEDGVEHRVGDIFQQNVILLDLFQQPEPHRTALLEGVKEQTFKLGSYSHFHFLRFLEAYKLNVLRENAVKYVDLFSNNQRFLKGDKPKLPEPQVEKKSSGGQIIDLTQKQSLLEF